MNQSYVGRANHMGRDSHLNHSDDRHSQEKYNRGSERPRSERIERPDRSTLDHEHPGSHQDNHDVESVLRFSYNDAIDNYGPQTLDATEIENVIKYLIAQTYKSGQRGACSILKNTLIALPSALPQVLPSASSSSGSRGIAQNNSGSRSTSGSSYQRPRDPRDQRDSRDSRTTQYSRDHDNTNGYRSQSQSKGQGQGGRGQDQRQGGKGKGSQRFTGHAQRFEKQTEIPQSGDQDEVRHAGEQIDDISD